MAITYVGSSETTFSSAASTTMVLDKPDGVAEGDIMFAFFWQGSTGDLTGRPTDWSSLLDTNFGTYRCRLDYKVAVAGEPANYTWTWGGNRFLTGAIHAWRGQAMSGFIHDTSTTGYVTSDTTVRADGIVTTIPTTLIFFGVVGSANKTYTVPSVPGTFTHRYANAVQASQEVADYAWATSGTAGNIDAILPTARTDKRAMAVALAPIPVGPPMPLINQLLMGA